MSKQETIAKAEQIAKSASFYRYNPNTLASIIEAGVIPDGAIVAVAGAQVIKYERGCAVCYKDGEQTKSTPCTVDQIIIGYAVTASRL
jgi:hypothetical protein